MHAGGPYSGTLVRSAKGSEKVYAVAHVPMSDHVCIWWSVGQQLEFYSDLTQSTTAFKMDKASLYVTSIGIDERGYLWTGHMKGMVRVRKKQSWEQVSTVVGWA
jgi:hypothetical protein